MAETRATINSLKSTNKALESAEFCPTCGKKLDGVDNSAKIKELSEDINNIISEGKTKRSELVKLEE